MTVVCGDLIASASFSSGAGCAYSVPATNTCKINNRSVGTLRQNTGETRRTQAFWGAPAPRVLASLTFELRAVTDRIVSAWAPKPAREARALPGVDLAQENA